MPMEHPTFVKTRVHVDWLLALTFITVTLVVTVLLYVSRF